MNINTCLNSARTFVGINNLVGSSSAFKNGEYQKCMTELAKAAVKWTAIGATFFGVQRLAQAMRPVHADDLLAQANIELQEKGKAGQAISVNTQQLLDHYAREKKFFKHWPEEAKTYVTKCIESNSPAASASAEYFIKGAIDRKDSGFLRTVIKTCATASTTTNSCESIQKVSSQSQSHLNQMTSACKTNDNAFCKTTRDSKVNSAIKNDKWEDVIKTCVGLSIASESCTNGLKIIEEKINKPSKDAWTMAKKIDAACKKNNNLQVCQIAHDQIIKNTLKHGKWDEIIEIVNRKCSTPNKDCVSFVEDVANSLIIDLPYKNIPRPSLLFEEITYPFAHFGPASSISLALSMAKNCVNNPSNISLDQAEQLIAYVKQHADSLIEGYRYRNWEVHRTLTNRINELKVKIAKLPAMPASPRTVPFTERPQPVAYKFDCTQMNPPDKAFFSMFGREAILAVENGNRHLGEQLKEADVDWESCGL